MSKIKQKKMKTSVATRLLRVVFGFYVLVVICVAAGQMLLEYQYQKKNISSDFSSIQNTFEHVLAGQIWNLDEEALRATVTGMIELPTIVGIKIQDMSGKIIAMGGIVSQDGEVGETGLHVMFSGCSEQNSHVHPDEAYHLHMFESEFPIIYVVNQNVQYLGRATIYSNTSVILRRVKMSSWLLIVAAVIQMLLLWFIFRRVLKNMLERPLLELTDATQRVTLDNLDTIKVDIHSRGRELGMLLKSFNAMVSNLKCEILAHEKMSENLRQSEEKLNTILGVAPAGIGVMKNLKFDMVNSAMCEMTGYSQNELLGRSASVLYPTEEDFTRTENVLLDQMNQKGTATTEIVLCRKDRGHLDVHLSATPLIANDPNSDIAFIAVDVTDRKAAEEALRLSIKKLALHVSQTPLAVIGWNLNFEVAEWNTAAEEIFGYTKREALGKPASFIVPEAGRPDVNEIWQKLIQKNGGSRSTNENVTKDGRVIYCEWYNTPLVDDDGNVFGVASQALDITSRKQAEEESERLMLAIEQSVEVVIITDAEGVIQYVNSAFEKVSGYSREEAVGETPSILNSGEHPPEFFKDMWETLASGKPWTGKLSNKKKDGTIFIEEATISPVLDKNGEVVNYVAAKYDVTRELELEDQLREGEKLKAVGQMAGGIAHDFNNLLQVISGYAELTEMTLSEHHEIYPAIHEIGVSALRGKALINQLLAFSRRQIINPEDLDLNPVIESLLPMLRGVIREHVELVFVAGDNVGTVHIDQGLVEQVMMNLCVNARDAMPDGGTLTIETENVSMNKDQVSRNSWVTQKEYIRLSVTDSGEGMSENTLEHIFEPFFTTKGVGKGTGLGLSSVFGIIKQHQGHINVYSEEGHGSVFKIYFPVVNRNPEVTLPSKSDPVVGGRETILVAEDDEPILMLIDRVLTGAGYTVLKAKDGEEAVQIFKDVGARVDLVLMDVIMPRLGGKQALEKIMEMRPDIPHMFASGYSENAVDTNFIKERGIRLLNKPYQTEELLLGVREVLDGE